LGGTTPGRFDRSLRPDEQLKRSRGLPFFPPLPRAMPIAGMVFSFYEAAEVIP
jgi:hypothetical protein